MSRRSSTAIGVSHLKRSQAVSATQVPIVYSKKSEEKPENILEKKVEIVTPIGPLPSKRQVINLLFSFYKNEIL